MPHVLFLNFIFLVVLGCKTSSYQVLSEANGDSDVDRYTETLQKQIDMNLEAARLFFIENPQAEGSFAIASDEEQTSSNNSRSLLEGVKKVVDAQKQRSNQQEADRALIEQVLKESP